MHADGWPRLFKTAFQRSRNAMLMTDEHREVLEVNGAFLALVGRKHDALVGQPLWELVVDGPLLTEEQWAATLEAERFGGEAAMRGADGSAVSVQWAATAERVTGGRRVLFVALSDSRWGARFRRDVPDEHTPSRLTPREREIVHLVALGASSPEIAAELHISHQTVRTHVRNAMAKLGARSRAHLVALALADGHALG
ncbi:MAG TPA: PAS and helix-turn-helix domain-containing protein [Solirubrobacteraceae bacterium]|nr:PAS and helix-turn-helix domain-containing protein [Solirubrobacteraceae bacterium]